MIDKNKIAEHLFLKLNNHIAIHYLEYLKEDEIPIKFKISGLLTILTNNNLLELNGSLAVSKASQLLTFEYNSLNDSHFEMLKIIKAILKSDLLNNADIHFKETFPVNSMEYLKYLLKYNLPSIISLRFTGLLLGSKLIKCVQYLLKCLRDKNEHRNKSDEFTECLMEILTESEIHNEKRLYTEQKEFYAKLVAFYIRLNLNHNQIDSLNLKSKIKTSIYETSLKQDILFTELDDDCLIEFNLVCLECQLSKKETELWAFTLNSHVLFVKLMASISFDYEIILNWLIENQTNFLVYFLKYLKYLLNDLKNGKKNDIEILFSDLNENNFIRFQRTINKIKNFLEGVDKHLIYFFELKYKFE